MQDPTETKHAKNTARLIPLLLPQTDIFVGELPEDFVRLQTKVDNTSNTLVMYPCQHANAIVPNTATRDTVQHIILLDGTWRKVKKLYLNNPWLHSLNAGMLDESIPSRYTIRQRPFANSYSTIEALAYTLNAIEGCSTTPFIDALDGLQAHWPML